MQNARISLLPHLTTVDSIDEEWDLPEAAQERGEEKEASYIGTLPKVDGGPLEIARKRHQELADLVGEVESLCASFESYDVSAQAAEVSLRRRVGSLALTRDALAVVVDIAAQEAALEGQLAPVLAGTYLWLDGVSEALLDVARGLNAGHADWAALRFALGDVAWLHDMTVAELARVEASDAFGGTALGEALDELSSVVGRFKVALDEPFG